MSTPAAISASRRFWLRPPDRRRFISDRAAWWFRWIARLWGTAVTVAFVAMAARGGIPRSPARDDWELYAQLATLIGVAAGGLISWRWQGTGAAIITAGAVALGVLAAVEHPPGRALLVALAFYLPGLLLWLDWQRAKPAAEVALLAAGLVAALIIGGWQARNVYRSNFGPVQPASAATLAPARHVIWIWSGAAATSSITIKAQIDDAARPVLLALSDDAAFSTPKIIDPRETVPNALGAVATFHLDGLTADSLYYYAPIVGGELDLGRAGRFRTFPDGPASYAFAFGSCASTGSNGAVFDTIRAAEPLFFLSAGDFFYANIAANDPARYWSAYRANLTAPAQSALYRQMPMVYVWDDHDFGPNDADRTSPSKPAAHRVYREAVPHYPLAAGDEAPIAQAFTVGRARFIVTDARSERSPASDPDDPGKTMLGAAQKAWLKQELLAARDAYPLIFWINSVPWISDAGDGGWGDYAAERQEIAGFIADNQITGLVMLSGDAHMLAIDDGTHSAYAPSPGGPGFPVFHAAALDRHGSAKGGPYSEGAFPGGGQFGLVTVADDGGPSITVTLSGRDYRNTEIVAYSFTVPVRDGS